MATCTTTVNVGTESLTTTLGNYKVVVHYVTTIGDPGSTFGPFASLESAERCLQIVAARTDVKSSELLPVT